MKPSLAAMLRAGPRRNPRDRNSADRLMRGAWSVRRYLPPFGFTGHSSLATRHSSLATLLSPLATRHSPLAISGSAVDAAFHRY